jgi:hypothetical protein
MGLHWQVRNLVRMVVASGPGEAAIVLIVG